MELPSVIIIIPTKRNGLMVHLSSLKDVILCFTNSWGVVRSGHWLVDHRDNRQIRKRVDNTLF